MSTIKSKADTSYVVPSTSLIPVIDETGSILKSVNPSQLAAASSSSEPSVTNDKSTAVLLTPTTGSALYILSADGRGNLWRGVSGGSGYSDDGGAYCGTVFIPTGGDGTTAWVRDYSGDINPEWFGATTASPDNSTVIQSALDTGETILINETFLCTDLTASTNGQLIHGSGMLKLVGSGGTGNQVLELTGDNIVVRGLTIDGNQGTGTPALGRALKLTGNRGKVIDCVLQNTDIASGGGHGVGISGEDCSVIRTKALNCGYAGFKTFDGSHRALLSNCQSLGHHVKGFVHNGDSDLYTIRDCYAQSDVAGVDENILLDAGSGKKLQKAVVDNCVFADNPNNDTTGNGAKFSLITDLIISNTRFEQVSTVASTLRLQEGPNNVTMRDVFVAKDINGQAGGPIDSIKLIDVVIGDKGVSGSITSLDGIDAGVVILERVSFNDYTTIAVDLEGVDQYVSSIDCIFDRDTTGDCFQWSGSGTPTTAGKLMVAGETIVNGGGLTASTNNDAIIARDNSRRVFEKASIPTVRAFTIGDFVRNTSTPSPDGNDMILNGWHRVTTGTGHVLNTDWYPQYLSTVSPAT